MTETIDLMMKHTSVRRFTEETIPDDVLRQIIDAGRAASNWKNFQSYSVIVVQSDEQKQAIYDLQPQKAILSAPVYLVFVGDLRRAQTAVEMRGETFTPEGIEGILISSVDASLAAQNTLLAAESLGYGGVFIGLIRDQSAEISDVLGLPDYTYPLFGIALGRPKFTVEVKPRLPYEAIVFPEKYVDQPAAVIEAYDEVQDVYSGPRRSDTWSERHVGQWGQPQVPASTDNLRAKKLL
jgi:nitroreductase